MMIETIYLYKENNDFTWDNDKKLLIILKKKTLVSYT